MGIFLPNNHQIWSNFHSCLMVNLEEEIYRSELSCQMYSVSGEDDGTDHWITVDMGLILQQNCCAGYLTSLKRHPHEDNNGVNAIGVLLNDIHFIYLLAVD